MFNFFYITNLQQIEKGKEKSKPLRKGQQFVTVSG
jgi:hypothetical protein